jgi:UrcA family protein
MRSKKIRMLLLSMLAASVSSLAMADGQVTVKSEVVRYDDLRLISAVGAAVLYGRLRGAADRACGRPLDNSLTMQARHRACVDDAVAKAVAEVNQPILTQYFETKRNAAAAPGRSSAPAVAAVADAR